MADIPLPAGCVGTEELPKTEQLLENYFNVGGVIIQRPGITTLNTTTKIARGQFVWNGALYQVISTDLIKITNISTGAYSTIGTVTGNGPIDAAIGFNEAVIVVREAGGKGYTLDSGDALTQISSQYFQASNSVDHINGRFVFIPFNGEPAFFSDVGNGGSIQSDAFFDAEELPDKNKACFNYRNILYIGGTDSFESFRNIAGATFTRLNARIQYGYIGGILEYTDTYLFIGNKKNESAGIYQLVAGGAEKISNARIDKFLSEYTSEQLANCVSGRVNWRGYDMATFTLDNHSFGYLAGNWADLSSTAGDLPFQGGYITEFNEKYYTAYSNKIGRFDKINTDYGEPFKRLIKTGYYAPENKNFSAGYLEVGAGQGYKDTSQTFRFLPGSYDSKTFDFTTQDADPVALSFDSAGTTMYMLGENTDDVFQYSLSTAWDISTASYASKSFAPSESTNMQGMFLNAAGTKLILLAQTTDIAAYGYTLSTAGDISTASYDTETFDFSNEDINPYGIWFKADGLRMYMVGAGTDRVHSYTLSTAWDVSTATYDSKSLLVTDKGLGPRDIQLSADGKLLWVLNSLDDFIAEYALSIPWDISTGVFSGSLSIDDEGDAFRGMYVSENPRKAYVCSTSNASGFQYRLDGSYGGGGSVALELSRDNVLWSQPVFRDVGMLGEYSNKLAWQPPGGLGYYEGFMGVQIHTYADINLPIDKLTLA